MNTNLSFTAIEIWMIIGVALLALSAFIYFSRRMVNQKGSQLDQNDHGFDIKNRNKYEAVNVYKFRGSLLAMSLAITMGLMVLVFNWETFNPPEEEYDYSFLLDEDVEIEMPRTAEPPPPPPPPPPSTTVIQEVPEDLLIEDEVEFMDQSLDAETEVIAPPPVAKKKADVAPPPPPPPPPEPEVAEIFKVVEEMPRFPGCEDAGSTMAEKKRCSDRKLMEFIYENIRYPDIARENGIEGTVVVTFVVEKDGKVTNAQVLKDIGAKCGEEALKVVNKMNDLPQRWIPGKQRKSPVRVQFSLPIRFKLMKKA